MAQIQQSIIQRVLSKVNIKDSGCWDWLGYLDKDGYGTIKIKGKMLRAHRVSYELFVKNIPKGLVTDHLCNNPSCVNPLHLEPVTNKDNILRGMSPSAINARKTHCIHGHEFTNENTIHLKNNSKKCRICTKMFAKKYYSYEKKSRRIKVSLSPRY